MAMWTRNLRSVRTLSCAAIGALIFGGAAALWAGVPGGGTSAFGLTHTPLGQATLDALYPRSGNPNFYPEQLTEGLELWSPARLWLFDTAEPDLRVDVTDGFARKLEALAHHESQQAAGGGLIEAARAVAARVGNSETPAESFKELKLR